MIPTPTVGHPVRSRASRALAVATAVTLALGGAVVGVAAPAAAAPAAWTVTSTEDSGNPTSCTDAGITSPVGPTLRDAVCAANNRGADSTTITLQAGNYQLDASNGPLLLGKSIGSSITLKGPSDRSAKIIGDGATSVLVLDPNLVGGVSTTISGITVTGGVGNEFGGGGILGGSAGAGGAGDTLTITNSTITDNRANTTGSATNKPGGGVQFFGGVLSIADSTISDNDSGTSGGGGVAYATYAATEADEQKFLVSNTVFERNSARSQDTAAIGGGAIEFSAGDSAAAVEAKITDSTFSGNTVAGAADKPARGGAILQNSGTLEITGTRFDTNTITGTAPQAGAAIHVAGGTLNAHFNSFLGNTGTNANAVVNGAAATGNVAVNAENNWWGCNRIAPGATGCDTASAGVTAEPSLALSVTADPVLIPLAESTAVLTASVLTNSTGGAISPASLGIFSDAIVTWSGVLPSGATISTASTALLGGTASTTFDAHVLRGPASVTASLGNATAVASFGMAKVPEFPGLANLEATIGVPVSATVSSDGYPAAAITVTGAALPVGLTLVDNGNGTATISGTPSATGITNTALTAVNSVGTTPQPYTVTVRQPVVFSSAPAATFTVDQPGTHTISTTGFPLSALVKSGALPSGVSLTGGVAGQADALLSGTPAAGTGGVYAVTFARNNGRDANVAQNFTLTVNEKPAFSSPASATLHVGDATSLSIAAGGGYPNDATVALAGTLPAGVTTVVDPQRGVTGLQGTPEAGAGGVYTLTLTATNSAELAVSQTVTLTVNEDPYITAQPGDAAVLVGNTASFTVGVGGYPAPSGFWQRSTNNGLSWTDLPETGPTLSVATTQADNGSVYRFFVSESAKSRAALLTVGTGPVIGSAGAASWAVDGAEHSFDVFASGIPDATITVTPTAPATVPGWLTVGTSAAGQLTISGTPPAGSGGVYVFEVSASNVFGTTAASTLSITVEEAPLINAPTSITAQRGVALSATPVTALGGYPATAFIELDPSSTVPPGVTVLRVSAYLLTVTGTPTVGGSYSLNFTARSSPTSPTTTTQIPVTVAATPTISAPATAEFAFGAGGSVPITVTPGYPTATTLTTSPAPGFSLAASGTDSYLLVADAIVPPGVYSILLLAGNGIVGDSTMVTVTVRQAPQIVTQPLAQTVLAGGTATFTASASAAVPSTGAMSAQWQRSGDGSTWSDVPGGTLTAGVATLSFTASQLMSGAQYRVVVTDGTSVTSAVATLTVGTPPQLTSATSAPFEVGVAGSFTVTATGTPTPALTAGALPAGLGFVDNGDGTATISGTPEPGTGGIHTVAIGAGNGFGADDAQSLDLVIAEKPSITSAPGASFAVDSAASFTVTSSPGYPGNVVLAKSGALPVGVTFVDNGDGTASLAGTADSGSGGAYALTITATNDTGASTQAFSLTVTESPAITSADSTTFAVGAAGSFTVTSSAGHPGPLALTESGALPIGVTFSDNGDGSASLAGTPAAGSGGLYPLTLQAANGSGTDQQTLTLTVQEKPAITSAPTATMAVGSAAAFTVTSSPGYTGPVALTQSGALPAGVTFADNGDGTASLAGTAATGSGGEYPLTLKATNDAGTVTQAFTLTITENPGITSAHAATITVGSAAAFTVTSSPGFSGPVALTQSGALPAGVTFTDNGDGTAAFGGTAAPGSGGEYPLTVTATNTAGSTDQAFTLIVTEKPAITSADAATITVGSAAAFTVTSSPGYSGAVVLTQTGTLPDGVRFTDNGDGTAGLTGTANPGSGGDYALMLKAKNGTGTATQAFTLTVQEAPAISSSDTVAFARGVVGSFAITADGGHPQGVELSLAGELPAGLAFSDAGDGTATISGGTTDPAGDYPLTLTATNSAGLSATQTLTLRLTALSAVTPPETVPTGSGTLEGVPATGVPGDILHVSAAGFAPDSPVIFSIYSTPTTLATVTADAAGIARATITIPASFTGTHSIVASGTSPTGSVLFLRSDITITADDGGTPTDPGTDPGTGGEKPAPGAAPTGLSVSGFDGGALLVGALALLLVGATVLVAAALRRRRTRALD